MECICIYYRCLFYEIAQLGSRNTLYKMRKSKNQGQYDNEGFFIIIVKIFDDI